MVDGDGGGSPESLPACSGFELEADKLGQQRFVYNQFTATLDPPM